MMYIVLEVVVLKKRNFKTCIVLNDLIHEVMEEKKQGWGAGAGHFWLLGAGAGAGSLWLIIKKILKIILIFFIYNHVTSLNFFIKKITRKILRRIPVYLFYI